MPPTVIRGTQVLDGSIQRADLDVTTVGQAVVAKLVQGTGISLSSTGADSGTGDVTVSGVSSVSTDAGNIATLGSDSKILVPQSQIWSVRLRSLNAVGNPTFEVDQRMSGGSNIASGVFAQDRWQFSKNASTLQFYALGSAGSVDLPGTSFRITNRYLAISVLTQQATLAAGEYVNIQHSVEGPVMRELADDVHSISLLVRSTVAGLKFGVVLRDNTAVRSLTKLCTIPSANVWTLIQLPNIPVWAAGGTYGTTPGTVGYLLNICLGAGSTMTSPANDTWQNGNFLGAAGQDNFASKPVNSELDIAFVQHEPGAQCSTPIDCPFGQNLDGAMGCLRYFQKSWDYGTGVAIVTDTGKVSFTAANSHGSVWGGHRFAKLMAKDPTVVCYNPATGGANSARDALGANYTTSAVIAGQSGISGFSISPALGATAAGMPIFIHYTADTGW